MGKQDRWREVLRELRVDFHEPVSIISTADIKRITGSLGHQEEPRLMASIDSQAALPDVFRENRVFLLPTGRGTYALVHGNGFHELEEPPELEEYHGRTDIPLTSLNYARGESRYLLL